MTCFAAMMRFTMGRVGFLGVMPFSLVRIFRTLVAGKRAEHYGTASADQLRRRVQMPIGCKFHGEPLDLLEPKFFVSHFTAAEPQRDLDLHLFAEEIDGVCQLHA